MTQIEWDQKICDLGGGILQSWAWGEFQKTQGHAVHRFEDDGWAAQIIEHDLMMGKKYWYAPRGPIGRAIHASDYLRKQADKDRCVVFLRMEPSEPMDGVTETKETQPKDNWVLGLEGSEEELLVSMKPKHRYNINLASKKGVTVREANKQDFLEIWRLLLETAARGGFRLHTQNYYLNMWETLGTDKFKVMVAEYEGEMLACVLLTFFAKTCTYLHGGSSDKNKQVMAPYLLYWEAIKFAKKNGYYNYDFGGISLDPNHAWAGISRFKRGFGGFEVRYPGTFDLLMSPLWYNVYKNGRKLRSLLR